MLGFAVPNSVVRATLGLVIVYPVYLYEKFVPYRKTSLVILCKEMWLFTAGKIWNVYRQCVDIIQRHW